MSQNKPKEDFIITMMNVMIFRLSSGSETKIHLQYRRIVKNGTDPFKRLVNTDSDIAANVLLNLSSYQILKLEWSPLSVEIEKNKIKRKKEKKINTCTWNIDIKFINLLYFCKKKKLCKYMHIPKSVIHQKMTQNEIIYITI